MKKDLFLKIFIFSESVKGGKFDAECVENANIFRKCLFQSKLGFFKKETRKTFDWEML